MTIRTGTFLCWLFGHKFIQEMSRIEINNATQEPCKREWFEQIRFCCRCGIDKGGLIE